MRSGRTSPEEGDILSWGREPQLPEPRPCKNAALTGLPIIIAHLFKRRAQALRWLDVTPLGFT